MMVINDYKLNLIFGRKGCGKSSTLAKLACKGARSGMPVYSNVPLKLPGKLALHFHYFKTEDFGHFAFAPDSLVLIDEINIVWDNRNFKNFDKMSQTFFRYQRHFKVTVFAFSQTYDCDKKIRDLADTLWIASKLWKLTILKKIFKFIYVTSPEESKGNSDIVEAYEKSKFFIPGCRSFIWLPRYWSMYDSFSTYDLPSYDQFYFVNSDTGKKIRTVI